jgi:hypothetical protein
MIKELGHALQSQALGFGNPEDNHDECKNVETSLSKEIVENRVNRDFF